MAKQIEKVRDLKKEFDRLRVFLDCLPLDRRFTIEFRHESWFEDDVFDALSAYHSVEHREVEGGTGPAAVRAQLEAAQRALDITTR